MEITRERNTGEMCAKDRGKKKKEIEKEKEEKKRYNRTIREKKRKDIGQGEKRESGR